MKAGIHNDLKLLDSHLRGNDVWKGTRTFYEPLNHIIAGNPKDTGYRVTRNYKMMNRSYKKRFSFLLHVFLITCCLSIPAQGISSSHPTEKSLDERKKEVIFEAFQHLYPGRWEDAITVFKKLDDIDPASAEGIFFVAFTLEFIMDQYRSQVFEGRLEITLDKAIERAKIALVKNPSARNYMFLGGSYGIKGVRQGVLGYWWRTFVNGTLANRYFKKAIEIDPTLYDCYYGIGSYHYWSTKRLRRFFGPLFRDKRMLGIRQLQLSIEKGVFTPIPSKVALFRIYMEEKWYHKVIQLAEEVLNEHPGTLFARWYYGLAVIKTGQWAKAINNYQIILKLLEPVTLKGPESSVEAWYHLALAFYHVQKYQKAKALLEKISTFKGKVNPRLFFYDDYVKEGEKLLDRVNEALERTR